MFKKGTPIILQSEVTECGLACLVMVFQKYGVKIDLQYLRSLHPISLKGTSLNNLISIADEFGFSSRALKLELSYLKTLKVPAILHWDLNHFVVLVKVTSRHAIVHDPAIGYVKLAYKEVSQHFTGIALEIEQVKIFQQNISDEKLTLFQLMRQASSLKKPLMLILFLSIFLQVLVLVGPQYARFMIDSLKIYNFSLQHILGISLLFVGIKCFEVAIGCLRSVGIAKIGLSFNFQLGQMLFRKLLSLPMVFFQKRHTGDIVSRFSSIDKIRQTVTQGIMAGIVDGLMSITTMIFMMYYSFSMSGIVFFSSMAYAIVRWTKFYKFRSANEKMIRHGAMQNTYFIESVKGVQPIKIFSKENYRTTHWKSYFVDYLNATYDTTVEKAKFNAAKTLIFGVELILVIFVGVSLIKQGSLSLGGLYAFLMYQSLFSTSVANFIDNILDFKMLSLYIERLSDIALTRSEDSYSSSSSVQAEKYDFSVIRKIEVRNIYFRYSSSEPYIYSDLSLKFNGGKIIGITGRSGRGKTTLMKLLMGLLKPSLGAVEVNGIDINKLSPRFYRSMFASVMQEDTLFSGNLYANITFFSENIDEDKLVSAAKAANIHEEIMSFPMQYHTLIGDMGTILSGGQKQRVLLARALYAEPKILFLDEATSHLDMTNESIINQSIRSWGITTIIIAHRKETLSICDRVIDLNLLNAKTEVYV